jgi:hypothetical protein
VINSRDFLEWDGNDKVWRPRSAAFRDRDGGRSVSVYAQSLLPRRMGPADVAAQRPNAVLFSLLCQVARQLGFRVEHRPEEDTSELAPAHCNVVADETWSARQWKSLRSRLLREMALAYGTITLHPPEGQ